jgi:hypothetical protein
MNKGLYKLISLVMGVGGALVARTVFSQVWRILTGEEEKPQANDPRTTWGEILGSAALEGAIFATVRAVINRAGAAGIERATGTWPE